MRFPRLFPPRPFRPVLVAGHAWCSSCSDWKRFDVIPGVPEHDIPAFVVCVRCGTVLVYELEEAS